MLIKLLGYAPDADQSLVGVITNCSGVVPSLRGMKGAPSPADTPLATLAATCQGAAALTKLDGTTRLFAATGKKIYEAGNSTWSDVSRAATYTTATTGRWRFAQEDNVSFAANGSDTLQASVSTGAFSCIAGAPAAAIVENVGKFVFALNTSTNVHGVHWSALNDYTSWSPSIATQAGSDILTDTAGPITAGRRFGNSIVVYKKNSMYIGVNAGPPNVWEFNLLPGNAGAMSQEAVVSIGTPENPKHIFMGEDDFYVFDGTKPTPIGTNRLKVEVFGSLLQSRYYTCTALHDRKNSLVYFYYPVSDSLTPDRCVVYNYRTDRWGVDVSRKIEATVDYIAPALTYDGLGASYSTFADLPDLAYDLALVGSSQISPAIFTTSHLVKTLTGAAEATSFTTGDLGDDSRFTTATRVWPRFITEPDSATLTNHYKNTSGAEVTADQTTPLANGKFDFIRDARWHRLEFAFSGDWEMTGFVPEWELGGYE
jgi:hypothetical protein